MLISSLVLISAKLAHQVNNRLQEAIGALDLALLADDEKSKDRRIRQSKDAMRKAADLVATHIVRSES